MDGQTNRLAGKLTDRETDRKLVGQADGQTRQGNYTGKNKWTILHEF